jgi:predicted nucleic acid-binding protein
VITLDTSAVISITNERDPDHELVVRYLEAERRPWLISASILAEVCYMLERYGLRVLDAFLQDLETGAYTLDQAVDIPRIRALVHRYHDLPLGFSDAAVIACGERNGGRVLSIDDRDFSVVARERTITVVPGLDPC